ncbi:DUF2381 family protein [Pyxidicoccus parkwayensis]|uniref:DUF2381 family protein n=2 Tax=Pyxidicoccus parkwayensis TaxID=2813578 RepID=A0ABX7PD49_9BACT|nr:DUF2381 family protein [Pyxidicoccus parkwaysis]
MVIFDLPCQVVCSLWNPLPVRFALLVVLAASASLASERGRSGVRTLLLSEHPDDATHRVYVAGQVITHLRFEQPVDAAKTRLLGWEGRFEPLGVVGRKVILEPLRDLALECAADPPDHHFQRQ